MKAFCFACYCGAVVFVCFGTGLSSCAEDRAITPYFESKAPLQQNSMDTIMFNVLAGNWKLKFNDTADAVLKITVHPAYAQSRAKNKVIPAYDVQTSLTFDASNPILMEARHPGDYPFYYFFKVYPEIGIFPRLEFDLFYIAYDVPTIKGVFYDSRGLSSNFIGT